MRLYRIFRLNHLKEDSMDKRRSLLVLVQNSFLLTEESKKQILDNLDKMSDDDLQKIGHLLALEKKKSLEENQISETILSQISDKT